MDNPMLDTTDLSADKRELLKLLLTEEGGDFDTFPLSFAQERLWFLDQLEPKGALYNVPMRLRFEGSLDRAALARALNEIARRHESMRTTFVTLDGRPAQLISPAREVAINSVDLSDLAPRERDAEARRLGDAEARKPFDLAAAPPWRALLARLSATEHLLLLTFHHIIFDGWSRAVLVRESSALYAAYAAGLPSPLEELPIQYADYAAWQREWLSGDELERQLSYWRGQLKGAPPVLELPTDRPRPARPSTRGATIDFDLPESLTREAQALGRAAGCTPFMTLLAAWKVLLSRYTDRTDIVVGTPVANRRQPELEGLIGFFVNTLVLRTDLSGDPTFRELLARVRETALDAYAHQDVPFERLVEELQPQRSLSHTPLFQVLFALQNAPREVLKLPGLRLSQQAAELDTAKFDLSLTFAEGEGGTRGHLAYSTELFDEPTIRRLASHYVTLLRAAVSEPERRISELSLLSDDERRQILFDFNDTRRDHARASEVVALVERQAAERPDALAVADARASLTYGELNRRANRLARHLRRLGVAPEVRVGVCAGRSAEMVAALLAVLKAGGAYLPLDPAYPRDRLAFMLEDARVSVLLTEESLVGALPPTDARLVMIGAGGESAAGESAENVSPLHAPDNLAYVIYTSGSTGRPKGVEVPHRGLLHLVEWCSQEHGLKPSDRMTQLASLSFDASVFEIWPALASGASLHLADEETRRTPARLVRWLAEESITVCYMPTPLAEAALAEEWPRESALRLLTTGGDKLRRRARADQRFRFVDHYGPTENSVGTTCAPVAPEGEADALATIGRPVANTRVYILDGQGRPVPVGVAGELYLGGGGLARGYLRRPELTAERFVPDPFSGEAGGRLYRTGDVGRHHADGRIEFLGRGDDQVKVRGFRVELGEIEAAIAAHQRVGGCAVAAREDARGATQLVAYVVAAAGLELGERDLRAHLGERLPEHMIPSAFVFLDELPLTPGGKIDRKALPAPELSRVDESASAAPRTPTEELLAGLWAEVLRVERVGVGENFFELGGHSLLAAQLVSRVREAFRVELPLRALFETPTVAGLADEIERALGTGAAAAPLVPVERTGHPPLSLAQQRLWFLDQLEPGNSLYNVPVALRLEGALDADALGAALREVVRRHESLRTTFREVAGDPVQVIRDEPDLTLPLTDLSALSPEEQEAKVRRATAEETRRPFDLTRGPLLRAALLRLSEAEHVLLLTMHHIVSDGWSMQVLAREVAALYEAFGRGLPSPLAELPIQYADYAVWQRGRLEGGELERQLAYWRGQLAGAPPALELQTDRPRPPAQSFRGQSLPLALPRELSDGLRRLSRREGVTLYMTLLAAFQTLLSRHAGQDDLVVGTPVAGRQRLETEGLIGFFVNTLVLRTDLSGDPTFRELLARVRETTLGAYAHQDVPFERLVEELQPGRDLSRTPLFQVLFNWQNAPREVLELPGLRLSATIPLNETAKFDLTLSLGETEAGLSGALNYAADLFDEESAARLVTHFENLLRGVVADPDRKLSALPLLTEEERRQLLFEFNERRRDYGLDVCVHELFEQQVARTPDAPALAYEQQRLSYAELNARANRLARRLVKLGVGPETIVGLFVERSVEMVVALLGVLKAGGAYLPLDPEYPQERVRFMLEDAGAHVLLTERRLRAQLPEHGARIVALDDCPALAGESVENPRASATPGSLAYVIYTSGSTGTPKGVAIEHRSVATLLHWAHETFSAEELSGVLASTSICFDLSIFELFAPLTCGGRVILADNALALPGLAAASEVTLINTVPSAMAELVRSDGVPASVKTVNLAGEPLKRALVEQVYERGTVRRVLNLYGPSEDTTYSTFAIVARGAVGEPTIGRPVANTQAYLLDRHLRLVPRGVVGELYLGGEGLSRGYLNRPSATAERYVPDPFSGEPGARLYRTGDLARWRRDGELEFLGRADHQVKVRGFRIELGEVEAALSAHEGVRACVVVAREDEPGDRRVVAYVAADELLSSAALRAHLRERLPDYMIPSVFVMLDELPLTPNGKVDRKALPAPGRERAESEREFVAPRNEVEAGVAAMWVEVLKVERVGVEDNFFELGGHSLLATRLIARVREAFGVELPLRRLFERPTVAGVALAVIQEQSEQLGAQELERLLVELEQSPD
jgi:amino acid adenylation domain-containing protein